MEPEEIGRSYDALAQKWQDLPNREYGMAALKRALALAPKSGTAVDIGCGSEGRMVDLLVQRGFQVEGVDVSGEMIARARERHVASCALRASGQQVARTTRRYCDDRVCREVWPRDGAYPKTSAA